MPKDHVRIYKSTGTDLYLSGAPATLRTQTGIILKAAHEEEGTSLDSLIESMNEELIAQEMPDSFIEKWLEDGDLAKRPDSVTTFELRLENWTAAVVGFAKEGGECVQANLGFQLSSSLFSSIKPKKARCLEDIFSMVHHVYGDSLNAEIRPNHKDPEQLIFRDSETICTVKEARSGGIFTSTVGITVSVYKRTWWDPSEDKVEQIVYSA